MMASVGHASEQALQPCLQYPSVGTITGDQSARTPCSKPAAFKTPVGQALTHSVQRIQLDRKSLSSRDMGGRSKRFADRVAPLANLRIGDAVSVPTTVAKSVLLCKETGCCEGETAGKGSLYVKKFASTGHSCEHEKHLMHSDSLYISSLAKLMAPVGQWLAQILQWTQPEVSRRKTEFRDNTAR
jgi:hypothetical protein